MSSSAMETAATASSGGTVALAGSLAWMEVNSTALGLIIAVCTMIMTGLFYASSIYLRKQEVIVKTDKVKQDLIDELYNNINNIDAVEETKSEAKQMIKEIINRRER